MPSTISDGHPAGSARRRGGSGRRSSARAADAARSASISNGGTSNGDAPENSTTIDHDHAAACAACPRWRQPTRRPVGAMVGRSRGGAAGRSERTPWHAPTPPHRCRRRRPPTEWRRDRGRLPVFPGGRRRRPDTRCASLRTGRARVPGACQRAREMTDATANATTSRTSTTKPTTTPFIADETRHPSHTSQAAMAATTSTRPAHLTMRLSPVRRFVRHRRHSDRAPHWTAILLLLHRPDAHRTSTSAVRHPAVNRVCGSCGNRRA